MPFKPNQIVICDITVSALEKVAYALRLPEKLRELGINEAIKDRGE